MKYRMLGDSGIEVSAIALGSWLTFGGGIGRDTAQQCLRAAFDAGINFIDTANVYDGGEAERALGELLAPYPRSGFVLATKVGLPMPSGGQGLSRDQIHAQLDASLARLGVDHVDLYLCHRPDPLTPVAETMEALADVVKAGKVRAIGFSEWPIALIEAALRTGPLPFAVSQPQYSLLRPQAGEELFPFCSSRNISQVVWSPLMQGLLSGKYRPGAAPPSGTRAADPKMGRLFGADLLAEPVLQAIQDYAEVARKAGILPSQLALAWVLRNPAVASAIVGVSRADQLLGNAAAADMVLDDTLFDAAESALQPALAHGVTSLKS